MEVPLTMPARASTRLAARPVRSASTMGMPPATEPSKPNDRPRSRALAKSASPQEASSALLAVTTCWPAAMAFCTSVFAAPSPPISSNSTSTSLLASERSSVSNSAPPSAMFGFGVRLATRVNSTGRPARSAMASRFSIKSLATLAPTVPRPARPTRRGVKAPLCVAPLCVAPLRVAPLRAVAFRCPAFRPAARRSRGRGAGRRPAAESTACR